MSRTKTDVPKGTMPFCCIFWKPSNKQQIVIIFHFIGTLTYIHCNNTCLLIYDRWSSLQQSERQQFDIITHLRSDQFKACSNVDLLGRTSGSNIVFPNLMLHVVWAILLQAAASRKLNNCWRLFLKYNSAFLIFILKLGAPCFLISVGKVYIFMRHNAAGFLWTKILIILK